MARIVQSSAARRYKGERRVGVVKAHCSFVEADLRLHLIANGSKPVPAADAGRLNRKRRLWPMRQRFP